MIADLINDKYNIRLITTNVMSIFSSSNNTLNEFISALKSSTYSVNDSIKSADSLVCYKLSEINKFESVSSIIAKLASDKNKAIEYISYLNLNYILWMKWYQLSSIDLLAITTILKLVSRKDIIILDTIDTHPLKDKLYSLSFQVGLSDKLVIIPFTSIIEAVNHSTCQCYIKPNVGSKILTRFSNEFLNQEFSTSINYYYSDQPKKYIKEESCLAPASQRYSIYDLLLIYLYSIKLLFIKFTSYWRINHHVS